MASVVRTLLRPARLLAPLYGSDRITPAIGDFYFWASNGLVTLPASRYDYSSDWTPLLAGLAPAGTAASFAAPTRRYEAGPAGLKAITALVVLRDKAIKPLLAAARNLKPSRGAHNPTPLDAHYHALRQAMRGVFHELGIAA